MLGRSGRPCNAFCLHLLLCTPRAEKGKLSVLKESMGNRHGLTPAGSADANRRFFQALNTAFAVLHDSKPVVEALQDFKKHKNRASDNVTQLIRRMSQDLKIDTSYLDDDFFDEPFTPGARGRAET